ncbi:Hypothetical protein PEIBARAKI_5017 [Petrimonas sp. IBARAKI]|jgi:hypothetical protein|nr:Hypothetical protein PEIBARAKI_5017 [Petrimonas sp. IBARAKI]
MKNRETLAASVLKKHLPSTDMARIENEIVKAMLEFSDLETIQGPKRITRERLIDLASQLEGIMRELLEASEAPAPNPNGRRNLKDQRIARHLNNIQKRKRKII